MDMDRIKKKHEELSKRREQRGKDYWNAKEGPNEIRVLPSWTGEPSADFYYETAYHWKLGPDKKKNCVCLKAEGKDTCPICDMVKQLYKSNDKENASWAKEISARPRVFWNVVDMDEYNAAKKIGKEPKGVQIMATGPDVLHQYLGFCINPKYGDLTDPIKGRNITLIFTPAEKSKNGFNDWTVQPDPDRTALAELGWFEHLNDLKALVKPLEPEKMVALMEGEDIDEPQPPQPDEEPKKEASAASTPPETKMACRGKYDQEDGQCLACSQVAICIEERKARLNQAKEIAAKVAPVPETPAPPEPSPEKVKEEPPVIDDKSTEVERMMAKIRDKQKKAQGK